MRPPPAVLPEEDLENLLKELIEQGLSITAAAPTQNRADSEVARYHALTKVLAQACIAGLVTCLQDGNRTEADKEAKRIQATFTVQILSRQVEARPELLLSTAQDDPDTPLYKWLLPCIISAAASLRSLGDYHELADNLIKTATAIVRALGTDLTPNSDGVNYGKGTPRMRQTYTALLRCLKGITHASSYPLYLFPASDQASHSQLDTRQFETTVQALVSSKQHAAPVAVVVAEILMTAISPSGMVPSSTAFIQDLAAQALSCLPAVWKLAQHHSERQSLRPEVIRVVAAALRLKQPVVAWPILQYSAVLFETSDGSARQWSSLGQMFIALESADLSHSYGKLAPVERLVELAAQQGDGNSSSFAAACALNFLTTAPNFDRLQLQALRGNIAGRGGVWDELSVALGEARGTKRKREDVLGIPQRDRALTLLRDAATLPDVDEGDLARLRDCTQEDFIRVVSQWEEAAVIPALSQLGVAKMLPSLYCALSCPGQCSGSRTLPASLFSSWASKVCPEMSPEYTVALLNAEYQLLRHSKAEIGSHLDGTRSQVGLRLPWSSMINKDRHVRLAAGRVLVEIHAVYGLLAVTGMAAAQTKLFFETMAGVLSSPMKETALLVLGEIGRLEKSLPDALDLLLPQLGASSSPIQSLATTEVLNLCRHYGKAPYLLMLPHIERVSILLASQLASAPNVVAECMRLFDRTRQNFFETTLQHTLPALVVNQDRSALTVLAGVVKRPLGMLFVEHNHQILAKIFMTPNARDAALAFMVKVLGELTKEVEVTASSVITSDVIRFLVQLAIELGSQDKTIVAVAESALIKAGQVQQGLSADLGSYLKPHMLGLISHMNDILHDIQGKKTVEVKRKVIRSMGALAKRVGGSMASFSPQIMASFQSTLEIAPLREETLRSWHIFVTGLKYGDIGPYVGATIAALVANWPTFTSEECILAAKTIDYLVVDNAGGLSGFMDDVVSLSHIPELKIASDRLKTLRRDWSLAKQINKILERSRSENICISVRSVAELRDQLIERRVTFTGLTRGDTFDPLVGRCMRTLFETATRDGERSQLLRDLSYECIGILGALDPDRIKVQQEDKSMTLRSNFTDKEESQDFALHLIRDVLVGAFRSTNDTKHQSHLAYAIQELLAFCGFTPKILTDNNAQIPAKIYARWVTLPKDQLETIAPLLEARFQIGELIPRAFPHLIYPTVATYREWLQQWTMKLVDTVMSFKPSDDPAEARKARAVKDSQAIFGVFRGVLRNGPDVSVAHHILPHLVLTVLCAGDAQVVNEIAAEIQTVLEDQVNPQEGTPDRRALSAQAVFGLMDHLSRWLLLSRQTVSAVDRRGPLNDRKDAELISISQSIRVVEKVINAIETELTANAALQSKAYARSLRNFEQRITTLRQNRQRPDAELQTYFENLHHIYADLDEPDGMEGVSSMILAPTLQTQIREHESTGRWTSAQSCWEVRLQQKPDDVALHVGLLRCLRNLGHYDTLRTHIRGVLSRYPEWTSDLAAFQVEAAWTVGDWQGVELALQTDLPQSSEVSLARVLLAMRRKDPQLPVILTTARRELGAAITASGKLYSRAYESVLSLHQLHEIEMIRDLEILPAPGSNRAPLMASRVNSLTSNLDARFQAALPSYKVRESLLSLRRTAFGLSAQANLRAEMGLAWISSAKIARKTGHEQTAYSATLQARELDTPFAFVQQAKLLRGSGGVFKALVHLDHGLQPLLKAAQSKVVDLTRDDQTPPQIAGYDRNLAKAALLEARWSVETQRFANNDVIKRYKEASELATNEESPHYHLGHYYDNLSTSGAEEKEKWGYQLHTCLQYIEALKAGTKYIYQTMPRMLTLYLDMGESKELNAETRAIKKGTKASSHGITATLRKIHRAVERAGDELPEYQWLTAYPQLVSRIGHCNTGISDTVMNIVARVLARYPSQAVWSIVGVLQSTKGDRSKRCKKIVDMAIAKGGKVKVVLDSGKSVAAALLTLCDDHGTEVDPKGGRRKVDKDRLRLSVAANFPYLGHCDFRSTILPLQDALTCTLPTSATTVKTHNPFPETAVGIRGFDDVIDVMPSLQRPKKLIFLGSDGRKYPFLCKPHDDLRKDARLMDFNSMINKLLNSASESRKRNLRIRTYAVMPLSEECGLLEWVPNTTALRSILDKAYARHGKKLYSSKIYNKIDEARTRGLAASGETFDKDILPDFQPAVFHEWFLLTWPEPSAWLNSRLAYARTLAVMSMIGYVLGLGDRHGENILFDSRTGDTVHVDFNCLFEKGKSFEIPERVPFRLTHNMVDALGVTGVEGVYRKAAEIAMEILRANKDSLTSVLEAFVHDPLVEWENARQRARESKKDIRDWADQSLQPIEAKLRGLVETKRGPALTVTNQVETLIKQATNSANLGAMYQGWAAWL